MFGLSRKVIELLRADPEWSRKLKAVKTEEDAVKVLVEFARVKGLKVKYVENEGKKE